MKNLLKQILKFVGISGIGWLMDYFVFSILAMLSSNLFFSNIISSTIGTTFVFVSSTRFVFQNNHRIPLYLKYVLYLIYQIILICTISKLLTYINSLLVIYLPTNTLAPLLSKILVTPITMVLNFIILKSVIEKL